MPFLIIMLLIIGSASSTWAGDLPPAQKAAEFNRLAERLRDHPEVQAYVEKAQSQRFYGDGEQGLPDPMLMVGVQDYSARKALEINPRYLPASLMPMLAGAQQFFEGHVWMGLNRDDPSMISWAALSFIFFSWLAWPVLVPLLTWMLEPDARKKRIMLAFAFAGAVLGLIMFLPYVLYPDWLTVRIARHSLAYGDRMLTDSFMPRAVTYFIYLAIIITPTLLSSFCHMRMFGLTLIGIVLTTYFLLYYAYISFFCFLAAAGTIHLIYIILGDKCCTRYCPAHLRDYYAKR